MHIRYFSCFLWILPLLLLTSCHSSSSRESAASLDDDSRNEQEHRDSDIENVSGFFTGILSDDSAESDADRDTLTSSDTVPFFSETPSGDTFEVSGSAVPILRRRIYTASDGTVLPYCLYLPANMEEDVTWPVVLFLHGAGERGEDNVAQTNDTGIVPRLTKNSFYAEHPAIILAPQCPDGEQWVDSPWGDGSYSITNVPISNELAAVTELLKQICQEYPADSSRLYAAGVSMGGYGAWDMLLRNPKRFAGAIILCGAGDPSLASTIRDIPLWIFHGTLDSEVPVSGSRDMAQALAQAGPFSLSYREYQDMEHWIWLTSWDEPGLLEALFSCTKTPTS